MLRKKQWVIEEVGGETYEYIPLGKYIVCAKGVCGGRPTFKYTRIEVSFVLELIASGETIDSLIANSRGRVSREAIEEALILASVSLKREAEAMPA